MRTWFNGADTTTIMLWLQAVFRCINEEGSTPYTRAIEVAIGSGNELLKLLYHGGLWLSKCEAQAALGLVNTFCEAYLEAAAWAYRSQLLRFKISPKYHAFAHFGHALARQAHNMWALNPLASCCQQDEDFVGKVCGLSVHGSFKLVHLHTVQRCLLNLREHW